MNIRENEGETTKKRVPFQLQKKYRYGEYTEGKTDRREKRREGKRRVEEGEERAREE